MTEQLPISIQICDDLKQQFSKITSVSNKLEAQFNFQTMIADWYGDEDNILFVQLCLETPESFLSRQNNQQCVAIQTYSDDAFSCYQKSEKEQKLICYIAITDNELILLKQQNKVLAGLLQVKLQKVLNLVANQLKLNDI